MASRTADGPVCCELLSTKMRDAFSFVEPATRGADHFFRVVARAVLRAACG
jgi:hypothetical protein